MAWLAATASSSIGKKTVMAVSGITLALFVLVHMLGNTTALARTESCAISKDGDVVVIEPFRAGAFPLVRDLVVDRGAFDVLISAGGYVSVNTGGAPEANAIPVPTTTAEKALDAAACIGCGACVAACPKGIKIANIARLNREYLRAAFGSDQNV